MPERVQLRRTKGWRKPEGAVVVSRPSKWGNPIGWHEIRYNPINDVTPWMRRLAAKGMFRSMIAEGHHAVPGIDQIRAELAGKDLACWCPLDQPCHADVLLEIANDR